MKPLRVSMQAFGPYLAEQTCDFTLLENSQIFLITGPTGSGKTSVLDAICFALYASATGELRAFKDMRNMSANDDLDTVVEYEFSIDNEKYKFCRRLEMYHKRNGTIEERISGQSYREIDGEWTLLTSGNEATTKKAEELLKFNHNQFSQVVVLPQGEFRKLLVASSKEKLALLQTLFSTGSWQRIIDLFSSKVKLLGNQLQDIMLAKSTLLNSIECEDLSMLEQLINQKSVELELAEKQSEKISETLKSSELQYSNAAAINEKFVELKLVLVQLDKKLAEKEKMDLQKAEYERLLSIKNIFPIFNRVKFAKTDLYNCNAALEKSQTELNSAKTKLDLAQRGNEAATDNKANEQLLREQLTKLNILLPECKKVSELGSKVKPLQEDITKLKSEISNKETAIKEVEKRISDGENYTQKLYNDSIKPLNEKVSRQNELKDIIKIFDDKQKALIELNSISEKNNKDRAEYENADKIFKAAEYESKQIEKIINANKAYSLSLELSENSPCPVCGSLSHPNPASKPAEIDDKLRFDAIDRVLAECKAELESKKSLYDLSSAEKSVKQNRFNEINEICIQLDIDEKAAKIEMNDLILFIEQANKAKSDYEKYIDKINDFKDKKAKASEEISKLKSDCTEKEMQLLTLSAQLSDIKSRIPENSDFNTLTKQISDTSNAADIIKNQILQAEKTLKEAENEYNRAELAVKHAISSVESAGKRLDDAQTELNKAMTEQKIDKGTEIAELIRDDDWFTNQKEMLSSYRDSVMQLGHRKQELEKQLTGKEEQNLLEMAEKLEELKKLNISESEKLGSLKEKILKLNEILNSIQDMSKNSEELEQKYQKLSRLYNFLSGKNSYKTPINNFVLGLTLDDVVQSASRYLAKFTKGRYSLIRVDIQGGTAVRGLDIEVKDSYIGGQRKVGTLSGGELFLASLSLALGLAEIVQSYSGGVVLDSIFIDEGFGSLDNETLDAAMMALEQIRREGRMVGIISHVSELKERIAARIEVIPSEYGARLAVKPAF